MGKTWLQLAGKRAYIWLLIGIVSSIVVALVEYANAAFIQIFLAHIGLLDVTKIPKQLAELSEKNTTEVITFFIVISFIKVVAIFFATLAPHVFSYMLNARLRFMTVFEILIGKKQQWLPASELHTRFGEVYPKAGNFKLQLSMAMVSIIQLILLFCGMIYVSWKETLVGVAGISLVGIVVRFLNKKVLSNARSVPVEQAKMSQSIERITRNWLLVKISGTQRREYNFLVHRISDYFSHSTKSILYSILNANIPSFFGVVLISIILLTSQSIFNTTGSVLITFFYLFVRFVQNLGPAVGAVSQALINYPQYIMSKNIFQKLDETEMVDAFAPGNNLNVFTESKQKVLPMLQNTKLNNYPPPTINISNINFAWDENKVFRNFSISIPKGKILGITGQSGSGKSTLLQLIMGTISPQNGHIDIDGISPPDFLERNSQSIGYVGADPFLFEGSIEDNLCYGLAFNPNKKQIRKALEQAQLWDYIQSLQAGLNYRLNENGEGLSSGQKQRLSLARAFLRQPSFLILDEASANLDIKTEEEIERAIHAFKNKCTILIVSHREGLVKNADIRLNLPI